MKKYIVTENFGNYEIWRSNLLTEKEAYDHAQELRNDNNRGEVKILEYMSITNYILN